jgi:hypothetical protein
MVPGLGKITPEIGCLNHSHHYFQAFEPHPFAGAIISVLSPKNC